jgi:SAM-dependent methyltransferase
MQGHYDADYWRYQAPIGEVGGLLNLWKFESHVSPTDTVLDFGCGGGYLLSRLIAREKIGVEIGVKAASNARGLGLTVYSSSKEIGSKTVDVVISNHALEHTARPFDELCDLHRVLRDGGRVVLVVPIDDWRQQREFNPDDPNHHLYTWTPLLLGNLLLEAGFAIESCVVVTRAWRPEFLLLKNKSEGLFRIASWLLARLLRRQQIHAVGRKEAL